MGEKKKYIIGQNKTKRRQAIKIQKNTKERKKKEYEREMGERRKYKRGKKTRNNQPIYRRWCEGKGRQQEV